MANHLFVEQLIPNTLSLVWPCFCLLLLLQCLSIARPSLLSGTRSPARRHAPRFTASQFKATFRLSEDEVDTILPHLLLPNIIRTVKGDVCSRRTAFLYALAYLGGCTLVRMGHLFGRSYTTIHRIFRLNIALIHSRWQHLLDIRQAHHHLLSPRYLAACADALARFGSPSSVVWGFLDGTLRAIARPKRGQRSFYNGWKRHHALKYQVVIDARGLIWLHGPFRGPRHDSTMLRESGLHLWLDANSKRPEGEELCIFGDKDYDARGLLMVPYKGNITQAQRYFNFEMSRVRVEVEHAIGWMPKMFPRLDHKRIQRVLLSPLAKEFRVAVLLVNAVSCISGNQTSQRIGLDTPSLYQYFRN